MSIVASYPANQTEFQVSGESRSAEDIAVIKTSTHFHVSLINWDTETTHSLSFVCPNTGRKQLSMELLTRSLGKCGYKFFEFEE